MTQNNKSTAQEDLDRLADSFVDDVLKMTDEEVLAEAQDAFGDTASLVAEMRELFEECVSESAKAKLSAAKEALAADSKAPASVAHFDRIRARREYDALLANDNETKKKLTLAARNGRGQSESDIESAVDDLAELGAFEHDMADK